MKNRCPSEKSTRTIRIGLGDYAFLNEISQRAGVTIAEALPMALNRPKSPESPLQIPLLPVAVTPVINESRYKQDLDETARLNDSIANLRERKAFLESPGYNNQVITKFFRNMDRDNYYEIGRKLGFLDDPEAGPEDPEVVDPHSGEKQFLKVQKEKPEDMTGWEYSKQQDIYVKVEWIRE